MFLGGAAAYREAVCRRPREEKHFSAAESFALHGELNLLISAYLA